MSINRREFIGSASVVALSSQAFAETKMPMRTLGKTGARVSVLAFGSGSRFLAYKEEDKALAALSKALDLGINYIDTAYGYGNGQSETWVGKLMPARRKQVFLATKINAREGDKAQQILEASFKRLQTDQVDLIHIHSLTDEKDLAAIEAPNGVLSVLRKLRDEKMTRFIGITSHTDPAVLKTALERHDFDCTQMALNVARAGMAKGISALGESHPHSFESLALPVAAKKKMGILAMKIFAQEGLVGKASVEQLIGYSLSLPVAAAVLGMPKLEHIEENIAVAKAFRPMPMEERKRLSGELSGQHKASLDRWFNDHVDA